MLMAVSFLSPVRIQTATPAWPRETRVSLTWGAGREAGRAGRLLAGDQAGEREEDDIKQGPTRHRPMAHPVVFRYLSYSTTFAEHAVHRLRQCPAFGRAGTCLFSSVQ